MASIRDIAGYYRPYWAVALLSTVGISTFQLIDLVAPYTMGQLLNALSDQPVDEIVQRLVNTVARFTQKPSDRTLTLSVLLGIIFMTTVVRAPIQPWISSWLSWSTALRARRDNFRKSLEKLLTLPVAFYDENNSGRISGRITSGITHHTWAFGEVAGQLIPKLCRLFGIFIIVSFIEWRIAVVLLVSFVLILSINLKGLRQLVQQEKRVERYREDTDSRTAEIVNNIKTVKAFATEATELKRQAERLEREYKVLHHRIHTGYVKLTCRQNTLVQCCVFSVLSFTLLAAAQHRISLGHFITTFTIANMAYAELTPIHNLTETLAKRYIPMLRFHELMQQPAGSDAPTEIATLPCDRQQYRFTGKVHFSNLSFGYNPERGVLHNINLLIEPCQTVALVGRSGSGKSTLVKLLFRYFEPEYGRILIDGEDIRKLDVASFRRRLAIVHQDVDLFNGTLLENLLYGNPTATMEQVREACRIAQAEDFIEQLPEGYHTTVGERGVRLSGGQRQRLGIARALLVDPDVLVFDEATSSLDYESERAIQQAMQSILGTRTTIIIAHRLSTIRDADKIVVLDQGTIAEVGRHDELFNRQGVYHRLHTLQEASIDAPVTA
ncbi:MULTISPECIES: ABC transporter ATP-binding protein [unclassified Leptolyngbya]|uniref:ABC transporter ATP-binding protein n=1 Tax=unclassified Leptolyngbya TaxID=2650499 RepID=UPI001683F0B5|nr:MULTISPECIES: ABC transporter ATP-binding protein [unclassified Leptolyngbya]MBD1913644.1 ABC transporter ATP-binding protein [Leptolyngbya sp. FACHB-8]MBD2155505.1 ABC transporter ATP-binding protein [Leptolyngbya sp. FACHB-16]